MALFGKKKNEYEEASKNLSKDIPASDRLIMEKLNDNDERAAQLVQELKKRKSVDFEFRRFGCACR